MNRKLVCSLSFFLLFSNKLELWASPGSDCLVNTIPSGKPSETARIEQQPDNYQNTPAEISKTVEALWQKASTAAGGLDSLNKIKTRKILSQVILAFPQGPEKGNATIIIKYPDSILAQFSVAGQDFSQTLVGDDFFIFNKKAGQFFSADGTLKKERPMPEAVQVKVLLEADPIYFFLLGASSKAEKGFLAPLDGMPGIMVRLKNGHDFKAYFDLQTFLLKKLIVTVASFGEMTIAYSDHRPVDGIQLPFRVETFKGTLKIAEHVISDIQLNAPVHEGTFP